jgi:hypothetical protein
VSLLENKDLELAKQKLTSQNLSLVIVKNRKVVFETKKPGVTGFLNAIETVNRDLVGSSVADKIVGVAVALLCTHSGVSSVFAKTISGGGLKVLLDNNIEFQFEKKVSNILNRTKTAVCPFEKTAISSANQKEAYSKLMALAAKMIAKSKKSSC